MRAEITTASSSPFDLASVVDFNGCGSEGGIQGRVRGRIGIRRIGTLYLKDHILLGNRTGFLVVILQVDFDPAAR